MIAFMRIGNPGDGNPRIWVVEDDGSNARPVTDGTCADTDPDLSPDGTEIVFVRHVSSSSDAGLFLGEIFVVSVARQELRRVTHMKAVKIRPRWSPDGNVIVFESSMGDTNYNIYTVPAKGGLAHKLTFGSPSKEFPAYSPDGSRIAYVTPVIVSKGRAGLGHAIWTMSSGDDHRQVSDGVAGSDREPAWSPDGRCIAFSRGLKDEWIQVSGRSRSGLGALHVMRADGSDVHRLTGPHVSYGHPSWSPDGSRIVAARWDGHSHRLAVMSINGADERVLTDPGPLQDYDPSWA